MGLTPEIPFLVSYICLQGYAKKLFLPQNLPDSALFVFFKITFFSDFEFPYHLINIVLVALNTFCVLELVVIPLHLTLLQDGKILKFRIYI